MSKETERDALHRAIWRVANDLRGSVDGWDFKAYVLGFLFYRFISENLTEYINAGERDAGDPDFDSRFLSHADAEGARDGIIEEKGFFIAPGDLFDNVRERAPRDENLNETLSRIFKSIEASATGTGSESDLRGLFDDVDVNSTKLGRTVAQRNDKLTRLMQAIGDLDLSYGESSIDTFGDAYEYLMTMYASNAGKSGGEFFTPQEVSEVLARITVMGKESVNRVYDPACGSGSLLLKFAKVLGKENVRGGFFGQEINLTTYNLCRINMFLHDINFADFSIAHGDTLTDPAHWDDEPFEAIVSNPPYSTKWIGRTIRLSSTTRASPRRVCWPRSRRQTWPSPCICCPSWRWMGLRRSSSSRACSTVAPRRLRSASTWWRTTMSTPSSSFRRTCSSGRRSARASSCSRSRSRTTVSCSWTPRSSSCGRATRTSSRRRTRR